MSLTCYHCGLPVPDKLDFQMEIEDENAHFCCAGCFAVASTIAGCGLKDFYQLRDRTQNQIDWLSDQNPYLYMDDPQFEHDSLSRIEGSSILSVSLVGLTCAACVWLIEKYLVDELQATKVEINQVSQRATIEFDESLVKASSILAAISSLGYKATLDRGRARAELLKVEQKKALMRLGVAAIGMMQVGMYAIALHAGSIQGISELQRDLMRHAALIISTLVVFFSAAPFFRSAWIALIHRSLVMDVPVSLAILSAYCASVWATFFGGGEVYFDSVTMFTFFLLLSRYLESQARSKLDIQPAQSLIPDTAMRFDLTTDQTVEVATLQLTLGDKVLIEPGKAIPADLRVLSGRGEVDESILSGEFKPVSRKPGDELIAGSLNGEGRFIGEVIRVNQDSSLASIDRLYEQALLRRSKTEQLADRLAAWFIGFVLVAALLTFLCWYVVNPDRAFWITLSVLVVSCPCALSLATPTSVTAAIFALRKAGILIRHSSVLDVLNQATDLVFDKTGTLTEGRAKIKRTELFGDFTETECKSIAASLEVHSSHPYSKAFEFKNLATQQIEQVEVIPGNGVRGIYLKGKEQLEARIGKADFVGVQADSEGLDESEQYVPLYLTIRAKVVAIFYIEDPVRSSSAEALRELLSRGFNLHLLSGDPSTQCQQVAGELGILNWRNRFSAEDKLGYIRTLQDEGRKVVFIGDGINDIPAMGGTDISVVVAQAPDLVQARADVGLVVSDLRLICRLLDQAKRLSTVLRQNISWAILYNLSAIPAAALGLIAPWLAVIGMSFSSVLVVLNSLRLKSLPKMRTTPG